MFCRMPSTIFHQTFTGALGLPGRSVWQGLPRGV